ncbi:MAG: group II intron reverse transcriptase/maturase [Planctomycetes bacterium]|nr:group II intron reverse transcriptase/maturase [Planctomycetota bacterium]
MITSNEAKSSGVPERATQGEDIRLRWGWVEHSVWTERMLTALEKGVKGGVWFSLIDKVWTERNLRAAFEKVAANGGASGVDHVSIEQFEQALDANLRTISEQLKQGTYLPQAIRRVEIPKPGSNDKRPLGIPTIRDRVVQGAIRHVMEPIFERMFAEHSYGFRPGKGCKDALRRVQGLLDAGYIHVVDADLKSYFDSIPHEPLMRRVKECVADGRLLQLIESFLKAEIMHGAQEWTPVAGAPQGAVLSPLLSNIYLNPFDHKMAALGFEMVRYADDFVILCRSAQEAEQALEAVRRWMGEAGLVLHQTKTRLANAIEDGFAFLGYEFRDGKRVPRDKSMRKLRDNIRAKTKRSNGSSMSSIIATINPTLRGWFEYFKHSHHWTFRPNDQWIRHRLRSILRRRQKRRGRGRGADHQRWPNAYFAALGLFNLEAAYCANCQPSRR